jgi:hypothetical protein
LIPPVLLSACRRFGGKKGARFYLRLKVASVHTYLGKDRNWCRADHAYLVPALA